MHSKSRSTRVLTTGSDISDPAMQRELKLARTQLQKVKGRNKDLNADKKKLLKENEDLKRQLEELRRG